MLRYRLTVLPLIQGQSLAITSSRSGVILIIVILIVIIVIVTIVIVTIVIVIIVITMMIIASIAINFNLSGHDVFHLNHEEAKELIR